MKNTLENIVTKKDIKFDYLEFNNQIQKEEFNKKNGFNEFLKENYFDLRTITLGIDINNMPLNGVNFSNGRNENFDLVLDKFKNYIIENGKNLINAVIDAEKEYNVKIRTCRISTSDVTDFMRKYSGDCTIGEISNRYIKLAKTMSEARDKLGKILEIDFKQELKSNKQLKKLYNKKLDVDNKGNPKKDFFIGGYVADLVGNIDNVKIAYVNSLSRAIKEANGGICGAVNIATNREGANTDIIYQIANQVVDMGSYACCFSAIANMPSNTPFFPAAYHKGGKNAISVGIAGAGVLTEVIRQTNKNNKYDQLENRIKQIQELMCNVSEKVGMYVANKINSDYAGVDLSQASVDYGEKTPIDANSICAAIEEISGKKIGSTGTDYAFGVLLNGLHKGSSGVKRVGYGGEFIPVTEDSVMALRMAEGSLTYHNLLSLSGICAAGIDMLALEKGTPSEVVAGMIMDVSMKSQAKQKPLGCRVMVPEYNSPTCYIKPVVENNKTYLRSIDKNEYELRKNEGLPAFEYAKFGGEDSLFGKGPLYKPIENIINTELCKGRGKNLPTIKSL
jgi:uncharacterized protein (UPF0210 family)